MRLLVDSQLPVRLVPMLIESGHDVVHTATLSSFTAESSSQISACQRSFMGVRRTL